MDTPVTPFDRRTFVKTGAAAASLPVILGSLEQAATAAARARGRGDQLKIGLIGCGGRGTGAASQALNADEGVVLWAMGDLFPEHLERSLNGLKGAIGDRAATQIDVPESRRFLGFDAYKKVIESGVDVVLLTTPPHFRPEQLEASVAAGCHVFTEKPMAVDGTGVRRCLAAAAEAKSKGLSLVAGFCWRYGDGERAVFDQINAGRIGEVTSVHTTYHSGTLAPRPRRPEWSEMEFQLRNWWHFTWLSGDHIVEQACHSVDRLSWAMGDVDPVRCTALGGRQARSGETSGHVYDHFAVIYEYPGEKRAFHTCRQIDRCPGDNTDYVYGTEGRAVVNGWNPNHDCYDLDGNLKWTYEGAWTGAGTMYQNEHDHLFKSIREGLAHNDGEWMMRSTLMAIMGRMAAYTGQVVTWEQALNSREHLGPREYAFGPLPTPEVAIPGRTKLI